MTPAAAERFPRHLSLKFEAPDPGSAIDSIAKLGGGGILLFLAQKVAGWFKRERQGQVEITARLIDDGADIRRELIEENRLLQAERIANLERAHRGEMATLEAEVARMKMKLERKDASIHALCQQLQGIGKIPVVNVED